MLLKSYLNLETGKESGSKGGEDAEGFVRADYISKGSTLLLF